MTEGEEYFIKAIRSEPKSIKELADNLKSLFRFNQRHGIKIRPILDSLERKGFLIYEDNTKGCKYGLAGAVEGSEAENYLKKILTSR